MMRTAFTEVLTTSSKHLAPMRTAEFIAAIQKVVRASEFRGLYG